MKRKIDLMSSLGLVLGFALMLIGIVLNKNLETGEYGLFWSNVGSFLDPTSVVIVIGGVLSGLMVMFPASQFSKIPKHLKIIFAPKQYNPKKYIDSLTECAKKARINGLLSLEDDIALMDDTFMKNCIQMVVDSVDPEKIKLQIESTLDAIDDRHTQERNFYEKAASLAPAFGMIGTLIGLVNMLKNLKDIDSVGPNMAVALVTTFYGCVLANLVFAPIANKLRVRHEEEFLCLNLINEGVQAIQAGENPKMIEERLINTLPEYQRKKYLAKKDKPQEEENGENTSGKRTK